jgi:copper transport protein
MRRRVAFAGLGVILFLGMASEPASAHAQLDRSTPAAGSQIDTSPPEVVLHFTEQPDAVLSTVHVVDSQGKSVETSSAASDPNDNQTLRVTIPPLTNGTYTVTWRTTSQVDGHSTAGSFAFGVGEAPAAGAVATTSAPSAPANSVLGSVSRSLIYAGLALLVGGVIGAFALHTAHGPFPRAWALGGAWTAAALGVIGLALDYANESGASLGTFLSSAAGDRLVLLAGAVVVTGAAIAVHLRLRWRATLVLVGLGAAGAMLARVHGGHAAASGATWFTEGTQWLHFVAIGGWVGGLPWFLLAITRATTEERPRIARAFARVATVGLACVAVTGTLRALDELDGWSDFVDTSFGKALMVKLGLFATLVALGTANHFWFTRRAAERPGLLARTTRGEVALGACVLGVTGLLTGLAPASSLVATAPSGPQPVVLTSSDYATTIKAELQISPGNAGPNDFEIRLVGNPDERPVDARAVTLQFTLPGNSDIDKSSLNMQPRDGRWAATGPNLSVIGVWSVTATVEKSSGAVSIPFRVTAGAAGQQVEVIRTAGQPTIYTITTPVDDVIQAYTDPGQPGFNELHITVFDRAGAELAIDSLRVTASGPKDSEKRLEARRFSSGHFVLDADLTQGQWTFTIAATTGDRSIGVLFQAPIPTEEAR